MNNIFCSHNLEKEAHKQVNPLADYLRVDYSNPVYKEEADLSNPNDTPSRRKIFLDNEVVFDGAKVLTKTINTLTTKQDRNPTSGLLLYPTHNRGKSRYRNFTPRECFLLMGFEEEDFDRLKKHNIMIRRGRCLYSREKMEKLAGNSIVVDVLEAIFEQIIELQTQLWHTTYLPVNGKKRSYHKREVQLLETM